MHRLFAKFHRLAWLLAQPKPFALAVLWLMVILFCGTVAEKNLGLYLAQQIYFSSWIIWLNNLLPLPGLLSTTGFIFIGLVCKILLDEWRLKNLGTIIAHIGAAVLLLGGFIAAQTSHEGAMIIPQGQTRDYSEDYNHVEMAITGLDGARQQTVFSERRLTAGGMLKDAALPFAIDLISWCRNCSLIRLPHTVTEGQPHGVALNFVLQNTPRDVAEENNMAGATFRLDNVGNANGLYAIFQNMPIAEIIMVSGKNYLFEMRPERHALPIALELKKFQQDVYPGTDKPRGYESDIVVHDNGVVWPGVISMNKPLHYKSYTFYQSSFTGDDRPATVLAIVKNKARLFPYLSSAIIALGLLIHLVQRLLLRREDFAA